MRCMVAAVWQLRQGGLLAFGDEAGELAGFVQDGGCVTAVRVIVLQQHGDHVGGKLVGPCEEAVTEALFFIVA